MRIEPAVFIILDFADCITQAEMRGLNLIQMLGDNLGQPRKVFQAMMRGETVSYRLAFRTRAFLLEQSLAHPPGRIIIGNGRQHRIACEEEIIDGPSDPEAPSF